MAKGNSLVKRLLFPLALGALGACSNDPTLVTPPTFERPGDVAFFCADLESRGLRPLSDCEGLDGSSDEQLRLTALVTQTARGEVAAVDVASGRALDADIRVPGYTFIRVGEVPSALVLPEDDPALTYVAAFGSRTVEWAPTALFREDLNPPALSPGAVHLPAGPRHLAMLPGGEALVASLPEAGLVRIGRNPDGTLVQPAMDALLDLTVARPIAAPAMAPAPAEVYRKLCIDEAASNALALPPAATPKAVNVDDDVASQPGELLSVTWGDHSELFVADAALPVIHRFEIVDGALTALAPIPVGVPQRGLAATPMLPAAIGADALDTRFLYGIDGTDGSVFVLDISDPAAPEFGQMLSVHSGEGDATRLSLLASAAELSVLTPGANDVGAAQACVPGSDDAASAGPARLRGVFLAVGLSTGAVQFVDVHDLDATCRGGDAACQGRANDRDVDVYIQRHRSRIGSFVATDPRSTIPPSFAHEGSPGRLADDGTPGSEAGPGLLPFDACPDGYRGLFPQEGAALICTIADPWNADAQTWEAVWEGALPFASGGRGRILSEARAGELGLPTRSGLLTFGISDGRLCEHGVLGEENVVSSGLGETDPERGYVGDRLFITAPPPVDRQDDEGCTELLTAAEREERGLFFDVVFAQNDALVLRDVNNVAGTLASCYPELLSYELRTRGAFRVMGSRTGFLHRVVSADNGCVVDTAGQPIDAADAGTMRNGRAFEEREFRNPFVTFQPTGNVRSPEESLARGIDARLVFSVGNVPSQLFVDAGAVSRGRIPVVVESMRYCPTNEQMFVVDANSDRLLSYRLSSLARVRTFE